MSLRPAILVSVILLLAACATPATDTPAAVAGQCNADAAQAHVGHAASTDMVEAARKDAGADSVRTLTPGQMVTMEFDDTRLTIDVDAQGRITALRCG